MLDGGEQLLSDCAYLRFDHGSVTALDEQLILRDIGVWSHFVADGSQPLHVTVHFNGWGDYPNPSGFSLSQTLHARFETTFVAAHAGDAAVAARLHPYVPTTGAFAPRVAAYLQATNAEVVPLYRLEAA